VPGAMFVAGKTVPMLSSRRYRVEWVKVVGEGKAIVLVCWEP